ncbi:uncharacterized protein METZ01_LOCUS323668 [marine metagenome]|uniref:Uncharacterized protein n=1 Tax=marine metagenome TaxID=408172 RepID=A0A382PBN4_9ZZZZ
MINNALTRPDPVFEDMIGDAFAELCAQ